MWTLTPSPTSSAFERHLPTRYAFQEACCSMKTRTLATFIMPTFKSPSKRSWPVSTFLGCDDPAWDMEVSPFDEAPIVVLCSPPVRSSYLLHCASFTTQDTSWQEHEVHNSLFPNLESGLSVRFFLFSKESELLESVALGKWADTTRIDLLDKLYNSIWISSKHRNFASKCLCKIPIW